MAYDEHLADRVRQILQEKRVDYIDKKMMGGLCFMVDDKMCVGIVKDSLMARIGPEKYEAALAEEDVDPMDFTGRPMKGYVFIRPDAVDAEKELDKWIQLCLDFNPVAKSSKKRNKKA